MRAPKGPRAFVRTSACVLMLFATALVAQPARDPDAEDAQLEALEAAGGRAGPAKIPAGVQVKRDLTYGEDERQRYDVYLPATARNAPVIFMVHGGAWRIGSKENKRVVENKVARWVPRGFIFISANYRMVPKADALEQARDVARALAAAQTAAASWGGDPARFILMGHSAGAHLVALIGASPDLGAAHGVKPWLGVVSLDSGALDVPQIMRERHARFYDDAFGSDPVRWQAASPRNALTGPRPPFMFVCSTRRKGPCEEADDFTGAARKLNTRVEILPQDKTHGAINQELGLPGNYTDRVEAFMATLDPQVAKLLAR